MTLYQLKELCKIVKHTFVLFFLKTESFLMNVKSKLKARTVRFVGVEPDQATLRVQNDIDDNFKDHNFKTELFNIFLVSVSFFLLFSGYNTLSQLSVSEAIMYVTQHSFCIFRP